MASLRGFTLGLLVLVAGCAMLSHNPGYRSDPGLSPALNVLRAAALVRARSGAGVRDVPEEQVAAALGGTSASGMGIRSQWESSNYRLLDALAQARVEPGGHPAGIAILIAWMPLGKEDSAEALESLRTMVLRAQLKGPARGYRLVELDGQRWYLGPGCARGECRVAVELLQDTPVEMPAPDFLGPGSPVRLVVARLRNPSEAVGMSFEQYAIMSSLLPQWVFIYLTGGTAGVPFPVLLSGGRPLYFVAPRKPSEG